MMYDHKHTILFSAPPPDVYELTDEVLGKGARSSVTTCIRRSTGAKFAVKVVPKTTEHEREKVLREVEILYLCRENRYNFLFCLFNVICLLFVCLFNVCS